MLPEGTQTHTKGGHLDQIFTNLEIVEYQPGETHITDHKAFLVKLRLTRREDDVDIRHMPSKITMKM